MATGYLQNLLGEDYEDERRSALNMGLLSAGLQGLAASGPSLMPVSAGQVLGQAGMAGLQGYQDQLAGAERGALQGMELDAMRQQQESQAAFKGALPQVFQNGKINYEAAQQLALAYPEQMGQVMSSLKAAQPPKGPSPVNLQFDASTGTIFNPRTGEVTRAEGMGAAGLPEGTTPEQAIELLKTEAVRIGTNDPKRAQDLLSLADNLRGKSESLGSDVGTAAQVLFGTSDVDALTPDQRAEAVEYSQNIARGGTTVNVNQGQDLMPFQKKVDETFAKDASEWMAGGSSDVNAQIAQLKPVLESLETGAPLTGLGVGIQPDLALAITNPQALDAREQVEEVVQRNLRQVLGAQFTEKEGERLISRAFNPNLDPQTNARRLRKLVMQMEVAAQQKQRMVNYAMQNGTLKDFDGPMPNVQDFYDAIGPLDEERSLLPQGVTVRKK